MSINYTIPKVHRGNQVIKEAYKKKDNDIFIIDTSFLPVFCSVKHRDFNNHLQNKNHFIECFIEYRKFLSEIYHKGFSELLQKYRHCHQLRDDKYNLAVQCIEKSVQQYKSRHTSPVNMDLNQIVGDEKLYQLGIEGSGRYIGTFDKDKGIYHLLLIDYHHHLFRDEGKNKFSKKDLNYSVL